MGINEGERAPDFSLPDQDGNTRSLQDFAGKWLVLYFYPKDDTPGCTTEACDFTAGIREFAGLSAQVVGVSPDSPESHRKFIAKYNLSLTLLSDETHTTLKAYGAWGLKKNYGKEYEGVLRSTVLLNPAGKVVRHWQNIKAAGHAEEVRAALQELASRFGH